MVICTFRSPNTEKHPLSASIKELSAKSLCRWLDLKPFDGHLVRGILKEAFPDGSDSDDLVSRVVDYSGGNPLFIRSIVQRLVEAPEQFLGLERSGDLKLEASEDLQRFLHYEFSGMEASDKELMETASVVGMTFTGKALSPLVGEDSATIDARCELLAGTCTWLAVRGNEATSNGSLTTQFEFRHGLYKDVVYRNIGNTRRRRMHRVLAETLERALGERVGEGASELAWRYEECGHIEKAIQYLRLAADQAIGRFAPRSAVTLLQRAKLLALRHTSSDQRIEDFACIVPRLANAHMLAGDHEKSAEEWRELTNALAAAQDWKAAGAAALELRAHRGVHDSRGNRRNAEIALELCAKSNDPILVLEADLAAYHDRRAFERWSESDANAALRIADSIRSIDDPSRSGRVEVAEAVVRLLASDYSGALAAAEAACDRTRRQRDIMRHEAAEMLVRSSLLSLGHWRRLLEESALAMERFEKNGTLTWLTIARLQLAQLDLECLDFQGALRICESAVSSVPSTPYFATLILAIRACAEAGAGHTERAVRTAEAAFQYDDADILLRCRWMLRYAEAEAAQREDGCSDLALSKAERLVEFARTTGETSWKAISFQHGARVHLFRGDHDQAMRSAESALDLISAPVLPSAAWRTLCTAATAHEARGQTEFANKLRSDATQIIGQLLLELNAAPELAATLQRGSDAMLCGVSKPPPLRQQATATARMA
jgi:tetratricopeptide (TPR) repeat protein